VFDVEPKHVIRNVVLIKFPSYKNQEAAAKNMQETVVPKPMENMEKIVLFTLMESSTST